MNNLIERLDAGEKVECYVSDDVGVAGVADYSRKKSAFITRYRDCTQFPFGGAALGAVYRFAKPVDATMYQEALEQHHSFTAKAEAPPHTASGLPTDAKERKAIPVYTGFINYFPKAIAAVAKVSLVGGIQHGQTAETLHWDRSKSGDELDAMMRHILDGDWEQVAWRAMANLEKKLESE